MSDLGLQQHYLNYLKWTEPLALMQALVEDEVLTERVVTLALDVDLMLGARLAGEVKPQFQEKMVGLVEACKLPDERDIPEWLKLQLYAKMKPNAIIPDLLKRLRDEDLQVRQHPVLALGTLNPIKGTFLAPWGVSVITKIWLFMLRPLAAEFLIQSRMKRCAKP